MNFSVVVPQGCGVLGELSRIDRSSSPPRIVVLHCEMQLPISDDLVSCGSCYLVSDTVCKQLPTRAFTGYVLNDCRVTLSAQYHLLHPQQETTVPSYTWLAVNGVPFESDFGMHLGRLIVSDSAKAFLECFKLDQCEITPREEFAFDWNTRSAELLAEARERLRRRHGDA